MYEIVSGLQIPKKMTAAITASILAYLGFRGGMDAATVGIIISPLVTFILGQGMADIGKEANKFNKENNYERFPK
jgi:hypothetical protein